MCFSRRKREEAEGASRSPLGAEQGTLRDCFGLRWAKKIAASVGGGTYCTRSTCIWILLSSLFASLEEREGAEGGESRSPLGAEQGTLRECFGLRWAKKKTATSVGGGEGRIAYASCVPGF